MEQRVTVIEMSLTFAQALTERLNTYYLVVHHAASAGDIGAAEINESHKAKGWAGCGYHYVIRYNGTVERGRPRDTIGAHAFGVNDCSIGVVLAGDFMEREPKVPQMNALENLLADLCDLYGLAQTDIIGHRDVAGIVNNSDAATACPGDRLYAEMAEIKQQVKMLRS